MEVYFIYIPHFQYVSYSFDPSFFHISQNSIIYYSQVRSIFLFVTDYFSYYPHLLLSPVTHLEITLHSLCS